MTFKTLFIAIGITFAGAVIAHADPDAPNSAAGIYAGTFLCSAGEMGMTLSIEDKSQVDIQNTEPCRSGSGPCNTARKTRPILGVINFFPTVGNPNAPEGVFEVSGTVKRVTSRHARIELEPGDWLKKPDNFGSSGLKATLFNDQVDGAPTADGCYDMKLKRIIEE